MVLPASFSTDNQAALDAVFTACEGDAACAARYPALRADWRTLLATLPRDASVAHPVTGEVQRLKRALTAMGAKPDLEIVGLIAREMGAAAAWPRTRRAMRAAGRAVSKLRLER